VVTLREPVVSARRLAGIDLVLVFTTLVAAMLGAVMVYTATRGTLVAEGFSPHYFVKRQLIFVVVGIATMLLLAAIDYRRLELVGMAIYGLSVFALVVVLVPHLGRSALGSARWFSLGPFEIQPSEFAVLGLIVAVATYCSRRSEGLTWRDVGKLLAMAGVPMLLVAKQPDLGTAIVMAIVLFVMLAVAGLPVRILVMLVVGAAVLFVIALKAGLLHSYQISRLTSFLHQDTHNATVIKNTPAIYNVVESKIAIGAGGIFGAGLGHGAATNLGYVPEQQTDFIFSAVGEQLGFVGATLVLGLLTVIAWRVLRAAQLALDPFGRLLCTGAFTFIAYSTFQNAGMAMGIMPVTGIPMPFVSYGGSAIVSSFACVGLTLSVYRRRAARRFGYG